MDQLPNTVIGLVAFLISGSGYLLWRMQNTFMTYIEKKNGNLERATIAFIAAIEEQANRHKQMMDEFKSALHK